MNVEFDPAKDRENHYKHEISLERAGDMDEITAMFDVGDSQDYGEVRYNAVGWIDGKLHTLTFTPRGNALRAISLRRANRNEREGYAKQFERT